MVRLDCAEATGYEPERSRHLSLIKAVAALARILDKFLLLIVQIPHLGRTQASR